MTPPVKNKFETTSSLGLRIQSFRYESQWHFPDHTHAEASIVVCTAGMLESIQLGTIVHLRAGEVLITNRNTLHSSRYCIDNNPTEGITIDLDTGSGERLIGLQRQLAPIHLSCTRLLGSVFLPRVAALALDLKLEIESDRPGRETIIECLAAQICIEVLRSWPKDMIRRSDADTKVPQLERWQFIRTIEFMYAERSRAVDWSRLAHSLGRDIHALQQEFVSTTNLSLTDCHEAILGETARFTLSGLGVTVHAVAANISSTPLS